MAEPVERSGGGFIYFIVGALVVAVAVIGYLALANNNGGADVAEIDIDTPEVEAPEMPAAPDLPDIDVDIDRN